MMPSLSMEADFLVCFTSLSGPENYIGLTERLLYGVLKRLKPGFQHVFLVKALPAGFLLIEPCTDRFVLSWLEDAGSVQRYIVMKKACAVPAMGRPFQRASVLRGLSCVSVAKYLLGIPLKRIVTPWQLYQFLTKEEKHG